MTVKALAAQSIVTPLISKGIVDFLLEDDGNMKRAAKEGDTMYTWKPRQLCRVFSEGLSKAFGEWYGKIAEKYDISTYDHWTLGRMTYRATGRNGVLTIMQNVSQLLTEKGFRVDFAWELVGEYHPFHNVKAPQTCWDTHYESKRTITIYNASCEIYPELELPKFNQKDKEQRKIAWMQVRPAMNVRWEEPNSDEVEVLAEQMLYELTTTKEEQALDEAVNLDSEDRMLRLGTSPMKRKILIPSSPENE